ncbi:MAG: F0F1 ATP synthase subunit B [Ktedonobacterales bacterium]
MIAIADLPLGINVPALIAQTISFIIMLIVLGKWAFPALFKILDQREATIRSGVENAERARRDVNEAQKRVEALLEQARQESQAITARANQAGERVRAQIETEARQRGDQIVEQAERRIRAEFERARAQLRQEVADLAIQAAEHVVGSSMDQATSRKLVSEFVAQSRDLQC